jgi:hypothetical protein
MECREQCKDGTYFGCFEKYFTPKEPKVNGTPSSPVRERERER